jgi:hypothetical protein
MEDRWDVRKVTVHLPAVGGLMMLLAVNGFAADGPQVLGNSAQVGSAVTLAWDPSPDPVSGYRLYQGTVSRNYSVVYDQGNTNNAIVTHLQAGTAYFFAVAAYDTNGLESDFSGELVCRTALPPAFSAPQITNFVWNAGGSFSLSGVAAPGVVCVLLATTNPVPPVTWTRIATNTVGTQALFTITDSQANHYPQRFYRIWQMGTNAVPPENLAGGN